VRGRVDPERHAAHDRQARDSHAAAEAARLLQPVLARASRANDRHAIGGDRLLEPPEPPVHVEHGRGVGKVVQRRRVAPVAAAEGVHPARGAAPPGSASVEARVLGGDRVAAVARERGDQLLVAERQQAGVAAAGAPGQLDVAGEPGDQP